MSSDVMKRLGSLHPDVISVVRSHDERSHSGVHGSELSSRERALMMLKSLEENEGNDEDLKFARNKLKQIDSEWVDSLNENDQRDCEEFKQFKRPLESSGLRPSEMHGMLIRKQLTIVMRNIEKLKLLMNKYKDDPGLVGIIRHKLGSIIGEYYGKGAWFAFHQGAHPEYIMNSFIYNPKPVLRIDGNQVTYQPHRNREPVKIGLDEFVKLPIGEVYGFFPDRHQYSQLPSGHLSRSHQPHAGTRPSADDGRRPRVYSGLGFAHARPRKKRVFLPSSDGREIHIFALGQRLGVW